MSFEPTVLFIATWDHVGYYDNHTELVRYARQFTLFHSIAGYKSRWGGGDQGDSAEPPFYFPSR